MKDSALLASVVSITSRDTQKRSFGTGFVIYRDKYTGYVLTCAHVVLEIGGTDQAKAGGYEATVVAFGVEQALDLAVLRVDELRDRSHLHLSTAGETGIRFILPGFQPIPNGLLVRPLRGELDTEIGLEFPGQPQRLQAWDLIIADNGYPLERGYSGAPVIEEKSGHVLGVASYRQGQKGIAIAIKELKWIWPSTLPDPFEPKPVSPPPIQSVFDKVDKNFIRQAIGQLIALRGKLKLNQAAQDKGDIDQARFTKFAATVWQEQSPILFNLLELAQASGEGKLIELLSIAITNPDDEATWSQLLSELLAWQRRI